MLPVLAGVAVVAAVLLFVSIGRGDLFNETDGQYASAGIRMSQGGDWLVPENNGVPCLEKPPFLVWLIAGSFAIFGENEFAARLPNALGIIAWVLATTLLAASLYRRREVAFYAGTILATCLGMFTLGRIIMPEPWFCTWIVLALLAGYATLFRAAQDWQMPAAFWGASALACFTNGWQGLLLPVGILIMTAVLRFIAARDESGTLIRRLWKLLFSPFGWSIFLIINVPWLLWVESKFPGYIRHVFVTESMGYLTGNGAQDTHHGNIGSMEFLILHSVWLFPWILVAAGGAARLAHTWHSILEPANALLLAWGTFGCGVLMAVGQRHDSSLMFVWPVFAIVTAHVFCEAGARSASAVLAGFGALACIAAATFRIWTAWLPDTISAFDARETAAAALVQMSGDVLRPLMPILWYVGAVWAVCGVCAWFFTRRTEYSSPTLAGAFWVFAAAGTSLAGAEAMTCIAPFFSYSEIGRWLRANALGDSEICLDRAIDAGNSLFFYSGRAALPNGCIRLIEAEDRREFATRAHGLGRDRYWTRDDLREAWEGERAVYFVIERNLVAHWSILLPNARVLFTSGTQAVMGNLVAPGRPVPAN